METLTRQPLSAMKGKTMSRNRQPDEPLPEEIEVQDQKIDRPPMDPLVKGILTFLIPAAIAFGLVMLAFG